MKTGCSTRRKVSQLKRGNRRSESENSQDASTGPPALPPLTALHPRTTSLPNARALCSKSRRLREEAGEPRRVGDTGLLCSCLGGRRGEARRACLGTGCRRRRAGREARRTRTSRTASPVGGEGRSGGAGGAFWEAESGKPRH